MAVTPLYAAVAGLLFAALSFRTLIMRQKLGVPVGHSGDARLERAIRAHGNFAEYVPLTLLVIYFLEIQGAESIIIHSLCSCLIVGRIFHAISVSQIKEPIFLRVIGMGLTFTALIAASARLTGYYI